VTGGLVFERRFSREEEEENANKRTRNPYITAMMRTGKRNERKHGEEKDEQLVQHDRKGSSCGFGGTSSRMETGEKTSERLAPI
jgi:hypothetical protein